MSVGMMQDECPIGYKKTEVGVIPADWEASRLDELGRWVGGMTPSMRNQVFWQFGTVPWISSGDVKSLRLTSTSLAVSEYAIKQKTTTRIPVKSIIVVTRSGILRKYLPVAMNMTPMAINQDIKALVPKDHVLSEFLLHLIIWNGSQILARCLKSGTTVESLEFPWLKGFKVPIPPFSEQHIIAEALFDTDAFIETLEQLIGKKRQIKQGAMQQLLTGKKRLPGFENEPGSKQTEVGNIPKDWDRSELGSILKSMQLGGNYKNSERESNWPLIKMGNLGRGSINIDKLEFISFTQTPASRDRLKPGDVLFNTRNTLDLVGKVAIWRGELSEAYFNSNIARMKFEKERVSSDELMNYILNTPNIRACLREIATGTTSVAAIYGRDLIKITVPLPTREEQEAIAAILIDTDNEIKALEAKLTKARQIKQGMMQELLTGRIRLI